MRIGHASIDENKHAKGGKAGDQNNKEVCIRNWYEYKGGWSYVLRCIDPFIADKMATICEAGCNNPNIGYDQNERNSLYKQFLVFKSLGNINVKCETDCSAYMTVCAIAAGIPIQYGINAPTTKTMKKVFKDTGKFILLTDKRFLARADYLKRGDILVKEGKHTVMVLDSGKDANKSVFALENPYAEPLLVVKKGTRGAAAKWVQWYLKNLGYKGTDGNIIKVDGDFGSNSEYALKAFQADKGLTVDGKCGPGTRKAFKKEI